MKKIVVLFLPFLMIPLCGCGTQKQISCLLQPFDCVAAFSTENEDYEAQVTYVSPLKINVSFLKPEALQGLVYSSNSDVSAVSYCGVALLSEDVAQLPLPEPVPVQLLRFLSVVGRQTLLADRDGIVTGAFGDQTFELLLDFESGVPKRLATDDIVCVFRNTKQQTA